MKTNSTPVSILYLDDEEHNLVAFRAAFRKYFQIFTTTSAREAVDLMRAHEIPIVITDQRMPDMMGVQFLEAIIPEFPDTIRMILTGFSDVEAIIKAINLGRVYRYITKPWVQSDLLMTLQGAAEMVRLQQQNRQLVVEMQRRVEEQERIMKLFQKYVPEHVVAETLEQEDEESILKGELRIVSVLIADIRNFTARAAQLEPREVVAFLNDYFAMMTDCVKAHHGIVNKFIGDGILAVFGAPVSYLGNQENAVLCALDMVERLREFHRQKHHLGGDLSIGIGINTGEVVVGNIGSEERVEYTVIGDTVNMAARIERLTKGYDNAVFISPSTHHLARAVVDTERRGPFAVAGKAEAIEVYQVLGRK